MVDEVGALKIETHYGIDLQSFGRHEIGYASHGYLVRHVRGEICGTWKGLHQEVSAAFQFPWYYGYNIPALVECLGEVGDSDLSVKGVVLSIWSSGRLFSDEPDRQRCLEVLESVLDDVAQEMKNPASMTVGQAVVRRDFRLLLHDPKTAPTESSTSLAQLVLAVA